MLRVRAWFDEIEETIIILTQAFHPSADAG